MTTALGNFAMFSTLVRFANELLSCANIMFRQTMSLCTSLLFEVNLFTKFP